MGLRTVPQGDGGLRLELSNGALWATISQDGQALLPATKGIVVDCKYAEYRTYTAISSPYIPLDDTIPQSNEGTQILTASITPKSTTNKIRIRVDGPVSAAASAYVSAAVFNNKSTDALGAANVIISAANYRSMLGVVAEHVPGVIENLTYSVRIAASDTTAYVNGGTAARFFGGVARWTLTLEEIAA